MTLIRNTVASVINQFILYYLPLILMRKSEAGGYFQKKILKTKQTLWIPEENHFFLHVITRKEHMHMQSGMFQGLVPCSRAPWQLSPPSHRAAASPQAAGLFDLWTREHTLRGWKSARLPPFQLLCTEEVHDSSLCSKGAEAALRTAAANPGLTLHQPGFKPKLPVQGASLQAADWSRLS